MGRGSTSLIVVLALVGVCAFLNGAYAASCGGSTCGEGEECCHVKEQQHRCYNPSMYSCLNSTKGKILCGYINGDWYPASACGDICYDGQFYTCCNEKIYDKNDASSNPCLSGPPRNDEQGCSPSCVQNTKCCNDTNSGPVCYDPNSHVCVNDYLLCGRDANGIPALACGKACYNASAYSCCNGQLYSLADSSNPCRSQVSELSLSVQQESEVFFTSRGFQSPPDGRTSSCNWNARSASIDTTSYELYNCTSITGYGVFAYNESYYLMSFGVPANMKLYSASSLSIYVDNSLGKTQPLAVSIFDDELQGAVNASGSDPVRSCISYKVFNAPLFIVNTTVSEGFVGYVSIDTTPLLTWFAAAGKSTNSIQLAVSALNVCVCLETAGKCSYTLTCKCDAPDYHIKVAGMQSAQSPKLNMS